MVSERQDIEEQLNADRIMAALRKRLEEHREKLKDKKEKKDGA